jgi:hypothetical protein
LQKKTFLIKISLIAFTNTRTLMDDPDHDAKSFPFESLLVEKTFETVCLRLPKSHGFKHSLLSIPAAHFLRFLWADCSRIAGRLRFDHVVNLVNPNVLQTFGRSEFSSIGRDTLQFLRDMIE